VFLRKVVAHLLLGESYHVQYKYAVSPVSIRVSQFQLERI